MDEGDYTRLAQQFVERDRDLRMLLGQEVRRYNHGEMAVLCALRKCGGTCSPSELARSFHLTKARITNIVSSLEEKGLVDRAQSSVDRRKVLVSITASGNGELERLYNGHVSFVAGFLAELGEDDAASLVEAMGRAVQVARRRFERCADTSAGGDAK